MYKTRNEEFAEKQIHQKVEITKIDILDTRKVNDNSGQTYEAVNVRAQGNLIRTGTVNKLEFREPVKFQIELLFIRNPDLLGKADCRSSCRISGIRKGHYNGIILGQRGKLP